MPMTRPPLATLLFTLALAGIAQAETTPDLQGLWQAHLRFGPEVQGALVVQHTAKGWWAEIGGLSVPATCGCPATRAYTSAVSITIRSTVKRSSTRASPA